MSELVDVIYEGYLAEASVPDVGVFTRGERQPVPAEKLELLLSLEGFKVAAPAPAEQTPSKPRRGATEVPPAEEVVAEAEAPAESEEEN